MVAAEGSELLRLPLRIFHVVVRESPSALACSSSAMRPARRSATSTSLSLIERLAFAAAMASPISLIFAVCRPRAGRREVRSGGRGPPFERRPGMQSSQHIQSALMLRLSARSHSPAEATLGPNPIPANIAAAARAMIDVRFMACLLMIGSPLERRRLSSGALNRGWLEDSD